MAQSNQRRATRRSRVSTADPSRGRTVRRPDAARRVVRAAASEPAWPRWRAPTRQADRCALRPGRRGTASNAGGQRPEPGPPAEHRGRASSRPGCTTHTTSWAHQPEPPHRRLAHERRRRDPHRGEAGGREARVEVVAVPAHVVDPARSRRTRSSGGAPTGPPRSPQPILIGTSRSAIPRGLSTPRDLAHRRAVVRDVLEHVVADQEVDRAVAQREVGQAGQRVDRHAAS